MSIQDNLETFVGKPVRDFEYGGSIKDVEGVVYRLRIPWEIHDGGFPADKTSRTAEPPGGLWQTIIKLFKPSDKQPQTAEQLPEKERPFLQLLHQFVTDPAAQRVSALVIGDWGGAGETNGSSFVVDALAEAAAQLPNLRALFFGDLTMEESEISWIEQSDFSPLLRAYPQLEHLQIRGANSLALGTMQLPNLHTLIIESGGLPTSVIRSIFASDLPNLQHLELWLGAEDYGADSSVDDLRPLLEGNLFPKLRYLGLRDSEYTDEIAKAIVKAPILDRIRILDLSMGTLSDEGGTALLASDKIKHLEKLDLHYHYLSDTMMQQFAQLGIEVDVSEQEEADEDGGELYRYVAVGE